MKHRWAALASLALLASATATADAGSEASSRTVVVMLFDGWAPSMVDDFETPALDRMAREGARSHAFVPAFPTNSLVNGVTISTGCWPGRHGIVANKFLDPERGAYDHSSDADWLLACEHLHEAAERQGVASAALGWYGRLSTERGALASYVGEEASFDDFPPDDERTAQVVALLEQPSGSRPRLILAYFRGPDAAAHFTGQQSTETRAAVEASDAAVGRVLEAVGRLPDRDRVTVLVTTDHGMLAVSHIVNVGRILRRNGIEATHVSDGSTAFLYFDDPAAIEPAVKKLSGYEEFDVFRKERAPAWAHLGTGPRVGDVILSVHPPYFTADVEDWPWYARWLGSIGPEVFWARLVLKATHGYPPATPGVEGILYAWGSGIAEGREVGATRVIDFHPTVAHLLGIEPGRPVDGRVETRLLRAAPASAQ